MGKSDLLGQLRGHASQFDDLTSEQEAFRLYGNTAVVTGCSKRKLASAATTVDLRYTLTFAKVRRNWKAVAYHEGRIAPGADKPLQVRLGYPADAKLLILNADAARIADVEKHQRLSTNRERTEFVGLTRLIAVLIELPAWPLASVLAIPY